MLLDEILNQREAIRALGRRFGAANIRVFGSVARRQEQEDSDVDFLVDLPRGYDLFAQRLPLAQGLSELLARRVDVIPAHELNPHMRRQIQQEAVQL